MLGEANRLMVAHLGHYSCVNTMIYTYYFGIYMRIPAWFKRYFGINQRSITSGYDIKNI